MHLPKYNYYASESKTIFEFTSKGSRGPITKLVEYTQIGPEVYNLGFGDMVESGITFDDLVVSNNGDSAKVLATVAATVFEFTETHPKASVFVSGSTRARTRLYRMGINHYLYDIQEQFVIFGYSKTNNWEAFLKEKEYEAFLLTRLANHQELWLELHIINQMIRTKQ